MGERICMIEGCDRVHVARGWCGTHYAQWRSTGDPLSTKWDTRSRTCAVDGCDRRSRARGWCTTHYQRWKKRGAPDAAVQIRGDDERRFWSHVAEPDENGCRRWRAQHTHDGYGRFSLGATSIPAHRFALSLVGRNVPDGYEPDHLCRVRDCVEESHLDIVTPEENLRRRQFSKRKG